jgi:hypothetical protein
LFIEEGWINWLSNQKEENQDPMIEIITNCRRRDQIEDPGPPIDAEDSSIDDKRFVHAWSPPGGLETNMEKENFDVENDMYPPDPEAEDPKIRIKFS